MKGRDARRTGVSTDFLVCFPSRAQFTLMPKQISSPIRSKEMKNYHYQLTRINTRRHRSPLFCKAQKLIKGPEITISEPTSPKVTCVGQIKVKSKDKSCKSWQSVMNQIDKIHTATKKRKKPNWLGSFGIKRDAVRFLTVLKNLTLDFRCFVSFHGSADTESTANDGEEQKTEMRRENDDTLNGETSCSNTSFAKWLMVLQQDEGKIKDKTDDEESLAVPPPNALLLMRCRSTPESKSSYKEEEEEEEEERGQEQDVDKTVEEEEEKRKIEEIEEQRKKESLFFMSYAPDFSNFLLKLQKRHGLLEVKIFCQEVEVAVDDWNPFVTILFQNFLLPECQ